MVSFALAVLLQAAPAVAPAAAVPERRFLLEHVPQLKTGGGALLAADDFGRIYRSPDGGKSWEQSSSGLPVPLLRRTGAALMAADPGRAETVYLLLRVPVHSRRVSTRVYRSSDAGRTWTDLKEIPGGESVTAMRVTRDSHPTIELSAPGRSFRFDDRRPAALPPSLRSPLVGARGGRPEDERLPSPNAPQIADVDMGDVAVLYDDGTFVAVNDLDLRAIQYTPIAGPAYAASFVGPTPITAVGTDLALPDDGTAQRTLPFTFPFYGSSITDVFISSNGNLTLGSVDLNVDYFEDAFYLATGPPRIAPLWDDFNPAAGGQVLYDAQPTRVTITWFQVPQAFFTDQNTFQVSLESNGVITMQWEAMPVTDGLTGITPGVGFPNFFSDLTIDAPFVVPADAGVYEWFFSEFWTTRVARRFYACHADDFDQLVVWGATDYPYVVAGEFSLAFADVARNEVDGLGYATFDNSPQYGSASVLRNVVIGGNLLFYPADPTQNFALDANTLDIVAQESGHQWGAYLVWDDGTATPRNDTLGRTLNHWSFYLDTDASVLEGNDYRDNLDGTFTTIECDERYSPLDLYTMGLIPDTAVPDLTLLTGITAPGTCTGAPQCFYFSPPELGVTVGGSATTIPMAAITSLNANGPRSPATAGAPTPLRQAWILVVPPGGTVNPTDVAKVEGFRAAFLPYFQAATSSLGSVTATMQARTPAQTGRVGNNLWLVRSYQDVMLDWRNGVTDPRRYIVKGTALKTNLDDTLPGIGSQNTIRQSDLERIGDRDAILPATRPSPYFYEVWPRDCADNAVVP